MLGSKLKAQIVELRFSYLKMCLDSLILGHYCYSCVPDTILKETAPIWCYQWDISRSGLIEWIKFVTVCHFKTVMQRFYPVIIPQETESRVDMQG